MFGDFVNVAQPILDQFIASGREKWEQLANIGLLLPHGYEGQGPEHSSARLERFLQLCAEDNMRVAYPTTPAQYFHLLRRQARAKPERPLVVMTPKSLLRLPAASSEARELAEGRFQPVLDDPRAAERRAQVRRLLLCAGKIYYDLQGHELRDETHHVAVGRIEELYPFPSAAPRGAGHGLPEAPGGGVGAGGAAQHGRAHLRGAAAPRGRAAAAPAPLRGAPGAGEHRGRQVLGPHEGAGPDRAGSVDGEAGVAGAEGRLGLRASAPAQQQLAECIRGLETGVRLGHLLRLVDRVHHRPHRASGEQRYDALGERAREHDLLLQRPRA